VNIHIHTNKYICIAPYSNCDEKETGGAVLKAVGELRINCGCKVFTTSLLLQASCTVISNVTLKVGDLLTQIPAQQDCCEKSVLQSNIVHLSSDVIKYILFTDVELHQYKILYTDESLFLEQMS